MPRSVPSCPCWAFKDGAWLDPVPPAPPQTLGMESPRLASGPSCHQSSVMTSVKEFNFSQPLGREPQLLRRGNPGDVGCRKNIHSPYLPQTLEFPGAPNKQVEKGWEFFMGSGILDVWA